MAMRKLSGRWTSVLPFFLLFLSSHLQAVAAADFAWYQTPSKSNNISQITVRQKVCDRYRNLFNDESKELKDALSGMSLRPILTISSFFNYNESHGINQEDPGLVVKILDELAVRANFTWRDSFAVSTGPEKGQTWTEMLQLYTEVFDISIDYWDRNTDRLGRGIAFMEQWFNGNMILIEKVIPLEEDKGVDYLNFMKPFTWNVWYVTLATIVFSALVYQWLEWLNNERDDRSFRKWFEDNMYLSFMNFPQQYMYEPTSGAGRIFGFSMAVWAMVMGATYTANLASLFVEQLGEPTKVADIDDAIAKGYRFCTWKGTNADLYLANRYPQASNLRVPLDTELETYQALQTGLCKVTVAAQATWLGYEKEKQYNPYCDLEWVGKTIEEVSSAFAVKADPADKCTNLIRDVLNYHLSAMYGDNTMTNLWNEYYASTQTIDCATYVPEEDSGFDGEGEADETENSLTRRLWEGVRLLKGGGGGGSSGAAAAVGAEAGEDDCDGECSSLSLKAMAGTFVLHACLSGLSILVGIFSWYRKKSAGMDKLSDDQDDTFPIGEDVAMTKDFVAGQSLASGTCARGNRINSFLVQHGTVDQKLQALFDAQKDLQQNQEQLSQQMELVVSMLTRMQEHDQRTETTKSTNSSGIGAYLFGSS